MFLTLDSGCFDQLTCFSSTAGKRWGKWDGRFPGPETSLWRRPSLPPSLSAGRRWRALTAWTQWSATTHKIQDTASASNLGGQTPRTSQCQICGNFHNSHGNSQIANDCINLILSNHENHNCCSLPFFPSFSTKKNVAICNLQSFLFFSSVTRKLLKAFNPDSIFFCSRREGQ